MKKCIAAAMLLALLSLSACSVPVFSESYANPTEGTFWEGSPDGLAPGVYHIPLLITTTDQRTGDEYQTEYIQSDIPNGPIPDGRVFTHTPSGGETRELRREDWTLDDHYNPLTRTVTVDGVITESYTYELTYEGRLLTRRVCLSGDREVYTEEYTYDASGNTTSVSHYVGGALEYRLEMVYDETSRLLTKTTYAADGSITERKEHTYDDEKLTDTVLTFDGSGVCTARQIDYYNPAGFVSQSHLLSAEGETLSITLYIPNRYTVH